MSKKKEWMRPKLIVLLRQNPPEGILQGCKDASYVVNSGAGSPNKNLKGCWDFLGTWDCQECKAPSSS